MLTTFPNFPTGIVQKEWRGRFYWKGWDSGMRVYRIWAYLVPNRGFLKRVLGFLSFSFFASISAPLLPGCDVIIVDSPPLFNGIGGIVVSALKRAPYLFSVADLWPESAVQLGVLKNRSLIWLSKQLELTIYRRAARVLALTEGIQRKIRAERIAAPKVILFRGAVDVEMIRPGAEPNGDIRRELGIPADKFVVLYAGTIGIAHNLDMLLEAAALFHNEADNQVHFIIAGEGAERAQLEAQAKGMGLSNVTFAGLYRRDRMPKVLAAADCMAICLRDLQLFRGAIPSKLLEAMAAGKPVLLAVAGEGAKILEDARAGLSVKPGDPQAFHDAVIKLMSNREQLEEMGRRGRDSVIQNFSRDQRARELSELIVQVVKPRTAKTRTEDHEVTNRHATDV